MLTAAVGPLAGSMRISVGTPVRMFDRYVTHVARVVMRCLGANSEIGDHEWRRGSPRSGPNVGLAAVWGSGSTIYAGGIEYTTPRRGIIARSTDDGETWTMKRVGTAAIVAIGGTGSELRALAADGTLATSTNHGESYTFSQLPESDDYESLDVVPGRLLAASKTRGIVRSLDGGVSWTGVRPSWGGRVWSIGQHVFAFHNGSLDQSRDGGTTWIEETTGEIINAVWGTAEGFIAVGQDGLVSTSSEGSVWDRRDRGVVGSLNDVWGSSDDDVYLVGQGGGRGGVIVHATEGAQKFVFARQHWSSLNGVWSAAGTVLVVGDRGTILRSQDRGATWNRVASGTEARLFAVGGCDLRALYAVGEAGLILYSSDHGDSWRPLEIGEVLADLGDVACIAGVAYTAGPVDVLRLDGGRVTRFGNRPTTEQRRRAFPGIGRLLGRGRELWWLTDKVLRRSNDGGAWQRIPTTGPHYAGWQTKDALWLGGWMGQVFAIDQAGRETRQWSGVENAISALWGTADGDLWAVGVGGVLVRFARSTTLPPNAAGHGDTSRNAQVRSPRSGPTNP